MFAPNLCAWGKMYAAFENVCAKPLRLMREKKKICGLWKCSHQTFASDEKYAAFENVRAKPLRLMKKYADFEYVCAKPLRLMKKYADFENGAKK
jgi:hypothetical protein